MRHSRTQTYGKDIEIETDGMKIEEVNNVKYLGTIVTKDNLTEEEIKERTANFRVCEKHTINYKKKENRLRF